MDWKPNPQNSKLSTINIHSIERQSVVPPTIMVEQSHIDNLTFIYGAQYVNWHWLSTAYMVKNFVKKEQVRYYTELNDRSVLAAIHHVLDASPADTNIDLLIGSNLESDILVAINHLTPNGIAIFNIGIECPILLYVFDTVYPIMCDGQPIYICQGIAQLESACIKKMLMVYNKKKSIYVPPLDVEWNYLTREQMYNYLYDNLDLNRNPLD